MANSKKTSLNQKKGSPAKKEKAPVALIAVFALTLIGVAVLIGSSIAARNKSASASESSAEGLVIPISEISETAKFYPIDVDGTRLEVVAVKAPDGTIRTAFNTCQVCYSSGRGYYKQQGNVLVCQNCGNRFPMSRVEVEAGGCNPWPIFDEDKTVTDSSITISYDFLKKSKGIFANWSKDF